MTGRPCFEVEFSDGEVIVADAEHQWLTWDAARRVAHDGADGAAQGWADALRWSAGAVNGPLCRTTAELAQSLYAGAELNHAIPTCGRLATTSRGTADRPVGVRVPVWAPGISPGQAGCACDPRGPRVGDEGVRSARLSRHDGAAPGQFMVRRGAGGLARTVRGGRAASRSGGTFRRCISGGSNEQRAALVQGLMDSEGDVDAHGRYRISTTDVELAGGLREMLSAVSGAPPVFIGGI